MLSRGWLSRGASVVSGAVLGVAVAAAIVTTGPSASARADYDSTYGYERTWNAALRLVRVDLGFKVTEKDEANGYLMFEYKSPESHGASPGSIELVRSGDPEAPVRVVVQLARMPRYHEQLMLDELTRKMRREYGDPPLPRPEPNKPQPPADAGPD
jgi:hypothetical protein